MRPRAVRTIVMILPLTAISGVPVQPAPRPLQFRRVQVPVRYREYEFAVRRGPDGVPRLDWERFRSRPERLVTRQRAGIVLENAWFRATVLPSLGRLHSFVSRRSGREQLWVNAAAIPIPAHNDTGFWVTWGGIECVLPRGEHGTSHALTWEHAVEQAPGRRTVRMWTREPLTGLRHGVSYTAYRDRKGLETRISIQNPGKAPVRFTHWTTALLAPGGTGQLTPRTEFVVPAERFVAADRPFNRWMEGLLGPPRASSLRFPEGWKDIGDLMSTPLRRPFYAAYCHEKDEGVVRVIEPAGRAGLNIWTWGYPPDERRQREFTAAPPNFGYVEFWNGTARDFSDAARTRIEAGAALSWDERLYVVSGHGGSKDLAAVLASACR